MCLPAVSCLNTKKKTLLTKADIYVHPIICMYMYVCIYVFPKYGQMSFPEAQNPHKFHFASKCWQYFLEQTRSVGQEGEGESPGYSREYAVGVTNSLHEK